MIDHQHMRLAKAIKQHLWIGSFTIVLLASVALIWSNFTQLASAVIAPGKIVVAGDVKTVKHLKGGVVAGLLVKEGQDVQQGQILLRLDATQNRSKLAIISQTLEHSWARQSRLEAERDGLTDFSGSLLLRTRSAAAVEAALASERRLFVENSRLREGQKSQLRERISQLREKITGYTRQRQAKDEEIRLLERELEATRSLLDEGLMTLDRVNNLARNLARVEGERGQLTAAVAEAKGKIAETEVELIQIDQTHLSKVVLELRDLHTRIGELIERELAASAELEALDIKAPLAGRVHQLSIHTQGGVVSPAESLMQIIPQDEQLIVEASVSPQDIDQLSVGQKAVLRLSAFNLNTTPELTGEVIRLSPDLVTDRYTGTHHYRVAIAIAPLELAKLKDLKLLPGMPVESLIKTGDRTVISYFLKPIKDHAQRAFREG